MKKRAATIAALVLASSVLATGPAFGTAPAQPASGATMPLAAPVTGPDQPAPGIPGDVVCNVRSVGVNADGYLIERSYYSEGGVGRTSTSTYSPEAIGFVPRALVARTDITTSTGFRIPHFFATSTDGYIYDVRVDLRNGNDNTTTSTKLAKTWGSVRTLNAQAGNGYLYGLNDNGGFYRYTYQNGKVGAPTSRATIGTSGWQGVKTLAYTARGVSGADTFVATTTAGQLVEYTIPHNNPAAWSRVTLKSSTWGNFSSLSTGTCFSRSGPASTGSVWLGIQPSGDAYLYYDKNQNDHSGADIVGYGKVASGWTEKYYSN